MADAERNGSTPAATAGEAAQAMAWLRPVELVVAMPFGRDPVAALPPCPGPAQLRPALESVLRSALSRPPCLLSFSGGRDSSALLALACFVARKFGLPDPIPATLVFAAAESDEESWQRRVLDYLGLSRGWIRLRIDEELDAIGPVAQTLLLRHGLFWPFNLHFHLPLIELARGGTLITGFGGDELARASASGYAERILAGPGIRKPRDLATVGLRLAPWPVRFGVSLIRSRDEWAPFPWLTARGRFAVSVADSADYAMLPRGFEPLIRGWIWRSRYFRTCVANFQRMAAPFDVKAVHPLVEAPVLDALAAGSPRAGPRTRTAFLSGLAGDLLPDPVLGRKSKATFTSPLWTERALTFAREWSGEGLDHGWVIPERLREAWLAPQPHVHSTTLLQAAWLRAQNATVDAPGGHVTSIGLASDTQPYTARP